MKVSGQIMRKQLDLMRRENGDEKVVLKFLILRGLVSHFLKLRRETRKVTAKRESGKKPECPQSMRQSGHLTGICGSPDLELSIP